ncbi:MAG: hypothetical protein JWR08_2147 [Enterovirga sp.]|jgi:hypothetical protein|nr:hypothetical protein [Enterovirga sp.]
MKSRITAALTLAAALGGGPTGAAQAQQVMAGTLNCEIAGGVGLIVTSRKDVTCTYQNAAGELEVYEGYIRKFGLDIGATTGGGIVWSVFAATERPRRGALAGTYVGGTAEASLGAGLGANALVGGSRRSVALQPVSVSGQFGFNLAVGVSDLTLRFRRER